MITDNDTDTVNESAAAQADDSAATQDQPTAEQPAAEEKATVDSVAEDKARREKLTQASEDQITTSRGVDSYDLGQPQPLTQDAKPAIDQLTEAQQDALKSAAREKLLAKATGAAPVPTVGRIVLYKTQSGAEQFPAVIVRVFHDQLVALKVFTDQDTDLVVDQALLGDSPGQWAWPPRS